ncbi:MAG: 3D domain-containing protein [Planctomycetota bacterium]|jgi:3D (Asp-Asp-Asp) domain-containing protein
MDRIELDKREKITAFIIAVFVMAIAFCRIGSEHISFAKVTTLSATIKTDSSIEEVARAVEPGGEKFIIDFEPFGEVADDTDGVSKSLGPYRTRTMRVTAYCACRRCCGRFSDGRTASGHRIRRGQVFCAADKAIPFNTVIAIPGYNHGQPIHVLDRGRVIRGNRLDVYFPSHRRAKAWGVKYLKCRIYKKRPPKKNPNFISADRGV